MAYTGLEKRDPSKGESTPTEIAEAKLDLTFREGDSSETQLATLEEIIRLAGEQKAALTAVTTGEPAEIPAPETQPDSPDDALDLPEADTLTPEDLTPEQLQEEWLNDFEIRFTASEELHKGIEWINVKNSLKADPESIDRLMAFDAKGHNMNVLGETPEEFIFVSAWTDHNQVSPDHRTITYDTKGQELAERMGYRPKGNAVKIIADIMGIKEEEAVNYLADEKFHEQLIKAIGVNGWAWLKTDQAERERTGHAVCGRYRGFYRINARIRILNGSFRAALRVKKA